MSRNKNKKTFTLDMAVGASALTFAVKDTSGREFGFRCQEPTDVVRQRMLDKLQSCATDQAADAVLADWLVARSLDGASRDELLALLSDPGNAPEQKSVLMTIVLTGKQPDPKLHGQLMEKLANRMLEGLIKRL